jgi:hypothetical protein
MLKLPPLPTRVFSQLGDIAVSYFSAKKAAKHNLCGQYDYCARTIKVRPAMHAASEWMTLWHEMTHVALCDNGAHGNTLTKEQEEVVCDAVGAYLTAMMLDGSLKVTSPGTRTATMK